MHLLKRLTFVVTLSVLSFGTAVSVAPTKAQAQSASDLIAVIDLRIAPLNDELDIIRDARLDAPNLFVRSFLLAEEQELLGRIGTLTAIQIAADNGDYDSTELAFLWETYTDIVSPDVPSVVPSTT